jgi:hypothetical protein
MLACGNFLRAIEHGVDIVNHEPEMIEAANIVVAQRADVQPHIAVADRHRVERTAGLAGP